VVKDNIKTKCQLLLLDEEIYLLKQISSLEIMSTATAMLAVVVESSGVFHVVG